MYPLFFYSFSTDIVETSFVGTNGYELQNQLVSSLNFTKLHLENLHDSIFTFEEIFWHLKMQIGHLM